MELGLLVLCWLAFRRSEVNPDRWLWLLLGIWALGNLLGDGVWTYFDLIRQSDAPSPGLADVGYLASYVLPIVLLLCFGWRTKERLRHAENTLDAAIFTLGAAGLAWPLLFQPMFERQERNAAFWVEFSYPMLDLLVVVALVSVLFGYYGARRARLSRYLALVCLAFLLTIVADTAYFMTTQAGHEYVAGGWMDTIWLLSLAVSGIAALLVVTKKGTPSPKTCEHVQDTVIPTNQSPPVWRSAVPYATLPVLAATVSIQASNEDWRWDSGTAVLVFMGVAMVFLLVWRQYLALVRNRRLYADLTDVSQQLEGRVTDLALMNQRLEELNDSSHHLTSLRQPLAVARAGLQTACAFTGSPGGWISIGEGADYTVLTHGVVEGLPHADPDVIEDARQRGVLRVVPLKVRDRSLGTMLLLEAPQTSISADLLPLVAAHLASALDNARRYEEALQLAERDPLTGLFNHRGIHRRLAGEALRAQQSDSQLSLIMIDLDDFKVLNDTYGHVAGDSVLRQVSDAIRSVLRHADLAGRVGGDEILLVLPNTGTAGARQLGERLRTALAERPYLTAEGEPIPVCLSLGVATLPDDASSVTELIEVADALLYASKQQGGNSTTWSSTGSAHRVRGSMGMTVADRLLDAVGARDHYTRRHSEDVVRNAVALGVELDLSEGSLRTLEVAAMLHDVGNLAVPTEFLRRPGPLTHEEEAVVRDHVSLGSELILDIPRLAEVVSAVSAHHERYDGSGYPAQTAGEDIPLLGRILAVADAYSAMTVDRPYRRSMTLAEVRKELLKNAGSQLDPGLVETFIQVLDRREDEASGEESATDGVGPSEEEAAAG
jgi:diguanylate cyclase (GGDEF)-like protein